MDECWPTEASPASVRLDDDPVTDTGCPKMHSRFWCVPISFRYVFICDTL